MDIVTLGVMLGMSGAYLVVFLKITIQTSPGIGDLEKHHKSIYLQNSAGSNPAEFPLNQTIESIEMS